MPQVHDLVHLVTKTMATENGYLRLPHLRCSFCNHLAIDVVPGSRDSICQRNKMTVFANFLREWKLCVRIQRHIALCRERVLQIFKEDCSTVKAWKDYQDKA